MLQKNVIYLCLNPCFNGILKYLNMLQKNVIYLCLNPCFNGILKYR